MIRSNRARRARKAGLFLASLLTAAIAAELSLATWRPERGGPPPQRIGWDWGDVLHQRSSTPGLVYELRPGAAIDYGPPDHAVHPVRINAHGMRDEERSLEKAPGVRRVAVIGDSTTFGYGVDVREGFVAVLGELLGERDPEHVYEALNFGVAGYNAREEAIVLERKALAFDPDLAIVGYNLNDPDLEQYGNVMHAYFGGLRWWQRLHLGRLIARKVREHGARGAGGNLVRYWHAPRSAHWRSVERAFGDISRAAGRAGVPVLVVIFPLDAPGPDPSAYRYRELHRTVAEEARRHGFEALDLAPAFARLEREGTPSQLPHRHPTPAGHRASAEAIAELLLADPARYFR